MQAILTNEQKMMIDSVAGMSASGVEAAMTILKENDWPEEPDNILFDEWSSLGLKDFDSKSETGLVDAILVVYTLAKNITPNRFTSHLAAIQVVSAAGLLPNVNFNGDMRYCLAVDEEDSEPLGPYDACLKGDKIFGKKKSVMHGREADVNVVILDNDKVALTRPGIISSVTNFDILNPVVDITYEGSQFIEILDGAHAGLLRAIVILAAELCGIARGAVHLAANYANIRHQFGRQIGGFQGVAHQLADAFVAAETAWSLTLFAAWALDTNLAEAKKAIHEAKAKASEAAVFAAERALQVYGGLGMTLEAPPHIFLRRALAGSSQFGGAHWHRCKIAREVLKSRCEITSLAK